MEDKKIEVNLSAEAIEKAQDNGKPVVIEFHNTDHTAPTLNEKVVYKQTDLTIKSISEFINKRPITNPINQNKAIIKFCLDPAKPRLEYHEDVNDSLATVLKSTLKENPDFTAFKINTQQYFTQKQLEALVMSKAHCFQDLQDAKDLLNKLTNFEVRYEQVVKSSNDKQGNTSDLVTTAIKAAEGAISGELKLSIPLFIGTPKYQFSVEIQIERGAGNMPTFGFYSLDLQILMTEKTSEIIMTEVNPLKEKFICLEIEA